MASGEQARDSHTGKVALERALNLVNASHRKCDADMVIHLLLPDAGYWDMVCGVTDG